MTFWSSPSRTPTARKQHVCQLCLQPIEVGTTYETWRCVVDDTKSTVKVHQACWALLQEYGEPVPWEGYYEISNEALASALRWSKPTREDCIRVAGEDGGRVWDLFRKPEGGVAPKAPTTDGLREKLATLGHEQ